MPTRTGSALALVLLVAGTAHAAPDAVEFYAEVSSDHIAADEAVRLEVTLAMNENREPEKVVMPSGADFDVISQNRSDQMSFALGGGGPSFRRVRVYTLVLHPKRQGKLTIQPGYVIASGKKIETGALQVEVGPPGSGQGQQTRRGPPQGMPGFPQMPGFGQMPQLPGFDDQDPFDDLLGGRNAGPPTDRDVFIRATVDRTDPWVGQQVTLTLHLASRQPLSGVQNLDMPQLDAFWSEDLESPGQLSAQERNIDGTPYFVYLLRRKAIFPLRDGDITIPPVSVTLTAGASLFGGGVTVDRKSQPIVLHVKPLPPAPAAFVPGSVGHYALAADASAGSPAVGDPITVHLTVQGSGNLRQLEIPRLPAVDGVRAYQPTHTEELAGMAGKWGGKKTLETVLVPERVGTFTVPAMEMPVFDPDSGAYAILKTQPLSFSVTPRAGAAASTGSSPAPQASEGDGLREVRQAASMGRPPPPLAERPWFLPVLLLPALVLAGSLLGPRIAGVRLRPRDAKRTAGREARRRLSAALKLAHARDAGFWAELDRALHAYLDVRLGRPTSGLTRDDLVAALSAAGAPEGVPAAVCMALDACDAGRFAPGALDPSAADAALAAASTAIDDLESGPREVAA